MASSRHWFITGCSTGLGRGLAEVLIERGENVTATARNTDSLDELVVGHDNARAVELDVTRSSDIARAVEEARSAFGPIDVLVNNAGYGFISAIEEAEESEYRDQFETNVFGLIAMTRAVLPEMRERRSGHIINISSVGGMVGNPGSGYYAGTKFAVVGFTESLSKEVAALGIRASVVEPGPFRTDWAGRSLKTSSRRIDDYAESVHTRFDQLDEMDGTQQGDPRRAGEAIIQIVDSDEPPVHLILGAPGLKMARQQLELLTREFDTWEAVTLSADFPDQN